jgi:eukaryotic-like serine/threonine-protein kinase
MMLSAGSRLGPYEIIAPIGAGGMGEVYKAKDTRLDRVVAIKVLPESLAKDPDRLTRFQQEARALSALNHPNLLAIFDVGTENGTNYLVSEFLEGQTLRDRLGEGGLPCRKAVEYARQIVSGMAAAHEKGIVHRDLKPDNIFLTRGDHAKILDFGLAKQALGGNGAASATAALAAHTMSGPTIGAPALTEPGSVMGTVGYMSPEQVRGQVVDYRSDIFSFGTILYEMVTQKRAFAGDSAIETMNAILKSEAPEIDPPQINSSPGIAPIVRHCMEKNPADRFQSARDLGFALGALSGTESRAAIPAVKAAPKSLAWLAAAALGALVAAVASIAYWNWHKPALGEQQSFAIPAQGEVNHVALSADGKMLAYTTPDESSGESVLVVQQVGSLSSLILKGTEGASYPFWSPDDKYVAFFADDKLKKIPAGGGAPEVLTVAPKARGGSWGSKNVILYAPQVGTAIWRINADGSHAEAVTAKYFLETESSHRWPLFLPDGEHFLFWGGNFRNGDNDPESAIWEGSLGGQGRKKIVLAHSNAGYANGQLIYFDNARKGLVASKFDFASGKVDEQRQLVSDAVGFQPSVYWAAFSASENGTVVFNTSAGATISALTWFDRSGKEEGRLGDPGVIANPMLSPDDQFVAADRTDNKAINVDIWIHDVKKGTASRFTFDPSEEVGAAWSRDGKQIAYRSVKVKTSVEVKNTSGTEKENTIFTSGQKVQDEYITNAWSADDSQVLCTTATNKLMTSLSLVAANGAGSKAFLSGEASYTNGQFSPDGKWVAYASNESGDWEIYVTTYPNASGKWQVSRGGGTEPRWRGDGKEMFYIAPHGQITSVEINTGATFSAGAPVKLFPFHGRAQISSTDLFTYDVTKDGKRFIVNRYVKPDHVAPLTIILNAGNLPEK